jgi:choice-of-anchor A domain-containing protein
VKISNFSSNSKWWPTNPTRITSSSASSENENPLIQMSVSQPEVSINQDVFNFAAAFADFKATSDAYENCSSNINLTPSGSYTFNLIDNKSNFFKIPASSLNNLSEIRFSTTPTASTPVIINVDLNGASSFTWSTNTNFSGIANSAGQFILFNFVNGATGATINIDGATIIGSIFAPYYNVAKNSSNNIEGQVICNHYLD